MQVLGSWNDWRTPGFIARPVEPGIWEAEAKGLAPDGCGGLNSVLTIPQNHRVEWRLA